MKNKLAPCPKCGSEVHIEIEDADYPCYEYVVCKKCGFQKMYHLEDGVFRWNKEFKEK